MLAILYNVILYNVILYGAFGAGILHAREQADDAEERRPVVTPILCAVVAIPSLLQLAFPTLLPALMRDADLTLRHGQPWRIVTALVVQDGGLAGLIFNLVPLALVGLLVERLWGGRRIAILFWGTGILSQFVGFAWQPTGAGNSVGDFGLAVGLLLLCAVRARAIWPRLIALVAAVCAIRLLTLRDIHGGACLIGLAIAAGLLLLDHRERGDAPAAAPR